MRREKEDPKGGMGALAVLAAAAREAEELMRSDPDLDPEARAEADRRVQLFMRTARQMAR